MISDIDRKKALNTVIAAQCFGQVASLCFINGIMFNYFSYLEFSEQTLVIFLRLPSLIALFTTLPLAYLSDMKGKSKLGQLGNFIQVIGLLSLCTAAYISGLKTFAVVFGVILFSFGVSLCNSSWFALLDPLINKSQRGPFFAKMRTCWKLFGVSFTFLAQLMLEIKGDSILAPLLMCVVLFAIIRMFFYSRIPELEVKELRPEDEKSSFKSELKKVLRNRDYVRYCLFILFLPLGISCLTLIYNLYEKSVLKFDSADIVLMGNLAMIGNMAGFAIGALALKRFGEKRLFLYCACCISMCAASFPLHGWAPWLPVRYYTGFITFCTGLSVAAMSIGITSLMLHLLPQENKSLSTSLFLTAQEIGQGISAGILAVLVTVFTGEQVLNSVSLNVYSMSLFAIAVLLPPSIWLFSRTLENSE
ncbi:MAG: MFS transporter [Lentisphaeraceae bacterium]|nr:MFS transporter [Lentisphaeraceae bacterium]